MARLVIPPGVTIERATLRAAVAMRLRSGAPILLVAAGVVTATLRRAGAQGDPVLIPFTIGLGLGAAYMVYALRKLWARARSLETPSRRLLLIGSGVGSQRTESRAAYVEPDGLV